MCEILKGHRQPQVFAGELVVGAIFCNTEIRELGKSNFIALHRRIYVSVAANLVNSFLMARNRGHLSPRCGMRLSS